jgi:predicted nucleic acid-binding Zn ribbon protein
MPGDNNRPLKDWLQVFSQSPQIRDRLYQTKVEQCWKEMMGSLISSYTRQIRIDQQTLFIRIESASLKAELHIMREEIRQRINEHLGEEYITDVRIQ